MSPFLYLLPMLIVVAINARRRQRLSTLTTAMITAILESRGDDLASILPSLTMAGEVGGATAISRAWLAVQQNDTPTAEVLATAVLRRGVASLPLAAINRLVLAHCAYRNDQTNQYIAHVQAALKQASAPVTATAIISYLQQHALPLPETETEL